MKKYCIKQGFYKIFYISNRKSLMIIYNAYFTYDKFILLTTEGCFVFTTYFFTIFLYIKLKFSYKIFSLSVQFEMQSTEPYAKLFTNTLCFILAIIYRT
jgi:hypothetical protein